jgi:RNA polymerase sigma factor (sigma-70 family)
MTETPTPEQLARRAADGDRDAVAALVRALQNDVYALSLRMLWQPADAEDATQEILVRVVTRLGQFDFRSRLKTWVYRIATNYLLDVKKSCVERQRMSFSSFAEDLEDGLVAGEPIDPERALLTEEVKIGCTMGLLQCLDRPHRLAYVLGDIFEWNAPEAAEALGIEPAAFRKRLQRARQEIEDFTRRRCGLVSETAACACHRRVPAALRLGRVEPDKLRFAQSGVTVADARAFVRQVEETKRVLRLQQSNHHCGPSRDFAQLIASALDGGGEPVHLSQER